MERGKRIEAVDGEIHLHEAIIQHIQSFLSRKEAAQTSLLCKSWYNAWATRPIVDLVQRHFQIRGGADPGTLVTDGFLESSKKIMRRYEESNLKIESFRLCVENIETDCFSVVNELILVAMKLGACDLNFGIMQGTTEFDLPLEVLRSENLVRLSVSGCRIDLEATGGKVSFSKLKSLSLSGVCIVGFSTFDIASNCPLIEELVLSECTCICRVRISDGNTVDITRMLALGSSTEFGNVSMGSAVDAPIHPYDNLRRLYLQTIQIDKLLFNDMSSKFPCLKDLNLNQCNGFIGLQICSPSLELLSISHMTVLSAKFDVPSLRKFTFSGTSMPYLSFEAASGEWESDISITYLHNHIRSSWLLRLKNFLMKLSLSKISLSLYFEILFENGLDLLGHDPCRPKLEVENLMLSMRAPTLACSSLLKQVCWTCRPKFVSIGREENCGMVKLLCKTLVEEESESCCIPSRDMSDMYGLEKVDVEGYEDSLAEWQPLPWKALVDALKSREMKHKIRFKLRWGKDSTHLDEILLRKGHCF